GEYGGRKNISSLPSVPATNSFTLPALCTELPSTTRKIGLSKSCSSLPRNSVNRSAVHGPLADPEAAFAAGTSRRDHLDGMADRRPGDYRRAACRRPGGACVIVGADGRLVSEKDHPAHGRRPSPDRRVFLELPFLDARRVLL